MNYCLRISGKDYNTLKNHLFPGDGKESVAIALCGRQHKKGLKQLLVYKLIPIPYDRCVIREPDLIKWSTEILISHLKEASNKNLGVVKIHSHPSGYPVFSETDNSSDLDLFDSVYGWVDTEEPHGSVIMLPNGELVGRVIDKNLNFRPIDKICVFGENIQFWFNKKDTNQLKPFEKRTAQTFGEGTTSLLRNLKIGIVGCSGTGSPVIEQLARLGVGHLIFVDPDKVEEKNLNRIINTNLKDAQEKRFKVDVLSKAIQRIGLKTKITSYNNNLYDDREIIQDLATCDVIFGCMDSVDGRHLMNQIANFYLIPYFDLGVKIIADGNGGIDQICGTIHYLKPGGSSLQSRGQYTSEELRAAGLYRNDPKEFEKQRTSGYISNVNVDRPAVISINMQTASMAVNEFLARIHPYRYESNDEYAITRFSLSDGYVQREKEGKADPYLKKFMGRGNMEPILNMIELYQ